MGRKTNVSKGKKVKPRDAVNTSKVHKPLVMKPLYRSIMLECAKLKSKKSTK